MDFLNAVILLCNFIIIPATAYGCQLALGALGVTLVYGILRFSNFAHGDIMAFGTMITILVTSWLQASGVSLGVLPTALLAFPVGIAATAALLLATDRIVYRFYRRRKSDAMIFMIASVGVMFVFNGIVRMVIGPEHQHFADGARFIVKARDFKKVTGLSEGFTINVPQSITVIAAIIAAAFLFWFIGRTRTGKSMQAMADNEDLANLCGVNAEKVIAVTWILTAALATTAGVLYGLDKGFKPFTYFQLLLPVFAAAIVGGLGNPVGAIAGGFVVSFSEISITYAYKKFLGYLLPESMRADSLIQILSTDYKLAVSFGILILVLMFRPSGLLARGSK